MELDQLPDPSLSLAGLAPDEPARARIMLAAELGYRGITIDATAPGLRPRDLDRSARRDVAATLRRAELRLAGLDLWIPSAHWSHMEYADRAVGAAIAAIELIAELSSLAVSDRVVSILLPSEGGGEAERAIVAAADGAGVLIADHRWPLRGLDGPLGAGLDPVMALSEKADPLAFAAGDSILTARLSTLGDAVVRVSLDDASSRLDLRGYRASLSIAPMLRTLVVDVRGLIDPVAGASAALEEWNDAGLG